MVFQLGSSSKPKPVKSYHFTYQNQIWNCLNRDEPTNLLWYGSHFYFWLKRNFKKILGKPTQNFVSKIYLTSFYKEKSFIGHKLLCLFIDPWIIKLPVIQPNEKNMNKKFQIMSVFLQFLNASKTLYTHWM